MAEYLAYIGTYSKGENGGIFRAMIDSETGDLRVLDTTDVENPSHLALAPDGKHLYAASETGELTLTNVVFFSKGCDKIQHYAAPA